MIRTKFKNYKNQFFLLVIFFLIELFLFFFLSNKVYLALALLVINVVIFAILVRKDQQTMISNEAKIKEATEIANETISYVSEKMPVGVIVWNEQRKSTWANDFALNLAKAEHLDTTDLARTLLDAYDKEKTSTVIGKKVYKFYLDLDKKIVYFVDITEQEQIKRQDFNNQTFIGALSIDNYDDAVDRMDDKEKSYLNSFITTIISDWMEEFCVYVKRLNAEKYYFVGRYEDLNLMMKRKFDVLDQLRKEAESQNIPITMSMGVSYGYDSLETIGDVAQNNLDIALIRGGDQVVLKESSDDAKPVYFGGKSTTQSKRTRVRSRAMSTALQNIFAQSEDIYIMGHRYPDMDALGSAFGVSTLAGFAGKDSWIVLDPMEIIPDVDRCLQEIHKNPDYEKKLVTPEEAIRTKQKNSLLVMVDYHKPSLSISEKLYETFDKIVIIDHHRRGDEFPAKPLLTYIESSASSASELITELIQQQSSKGQRIAKFEATLLLAGMVVDTKSFSIRTTSRTFDIASFLRSSGADAPMVQYLLSTDLKSYLEISELISGVEYVTADIVVANGTEENIYDSITAAKTADTLLSMSGIKAAFVITKRTDGLIGISARSTGTINVQVIMETMGGGGHFTNAATQLKDVTVAEAKEQLLQLINENINQIYEKE